jgi:glutamine cyclotransferase
MPGLPRLGRLLLLPVLSVVVCCADAESTRAGGVDAPVPAPPPAFEPTPAPAMYTYRVVNTYPHDPSAFTQGLVYHDGHLFESTGLHGESTLRKVRLETGEVLERRALDATYFAEGLTAWQDRLVQLTWQAGRGFVYDLASLDVVRTFEYTGEGWGLTHDGTQLLMSDGSSTLRRLDPGTFAERGRLAVRDRGSPVGQLNELEYVRGEIWANIWQADRIARISPETGDVIGWVDLAGILPAGERLQADAVLNGIAYDEAGDRLFVTGKLWPKLFEIRVERRRVP